MSRHLPAVRGRGARDVDGTPGGHAGHGTDRGLLHHDPARPAGPRPGRGRLLPLRGAAAGAGKAVLVTKPLARSATEAREVLDTVERAGVFGGYLEDLVYTPKTRK